MNEQIAADLCMCVCRTKSSYCLSILGAHAEHPRLRLCPKMAAHICGVCVPPMPMLATHSVRNPVCVCR